MASKSIQLVLALYTGVDYVHGQGAGIGVVQRAECATTGILKHQQIPCQERRYGYKRKSLVVENIKTSSRAKMLALVHALDLAHDTIKRGYHKAIQLRKVVVFSDADATMVVQTVHHHIEHNPDSLRDVARTNDRLMIKRVIDRVQRLTRHGLEVTITVSNREHKAGKRAKTMARQRGSKACRSRRRLQ